MSQSRSYLHQISISNGGVPKLPVMEARITPEGVDGDRQQNRDIHGGVDRAVCVFSLELIEALQAEGHTIKPGSSGDNLTIAGLEWSQVKPGNKLRIGEHVLLEVRSFTSPCKSNAQWFVGGNFSRISQKLHPGWSRVYARVLEAGVVKSGDPVSVESKTNSMLRASDGETTVHCGAEAPSLHSSERCSIKDGMTGGALH